MIYNFDNNVLENDLEKRFPSYSSSDLPGGFCFPTMATVKVENGYSKPISELQTGDRVQTGIDSISIKWSVVSEKQISVTIPEI